MTAVIHRGDGNGRSPFQVSVGVVRLRRWWLVTQEDISLSLSPLVLLAKVSGRLSSPGPISVLRHEPTHPPTCQTRDP